MSAIRSNHTELVSDKILNETMNINGIFGVQKLREVLFDEFAGPIIPEQKPRGNSENMNCMISQTRKVMQQFASVKIDEFGHQLALIDEKPSAVDEINAKAMKILESRPDFLSLVKTRQVMLEFRDCVQEIVDSLNN